MYLSTLEYALVRLGVAAVRLVLRAVGLLFLAAAWAFGVLVGLVLRSLMRELARALGRLTWSSGAGSALEITGGPGLRR